MSNWTDKTIPIECAECNIDLEGLEAVVSHIIDFHPAYSLAEAKEYAEVWMEGAYEKAEQFERDYSENRKIDRAIEADREYREFLRRRESL